MNVEVYQQKLHTEVHLLSIIEKITLLNKQKTFDKLVYFRNISQRRHQSERIAQVFESYSEYRSYLIFVKMKHFNVCDLLQFLLFFILFQLFFFLNIS